MRCTSNAKVSLVQICREGSLEHICKMKSYMSHKLRFYATAKEGRKLFLDFLVGKVSVFLVSS